LRYADKLPAAHDRHISTLRTKIAALHYLDRDAEARIVGSEVLRRHQASRWPGYLRGHPAGEYESGRRVRSRAACGGYSIDQREGGGCQEKVVWRLRRVRGFWRFRRFGGFCGYRGFWRSATWVRRPRPFLGAGADAIYDPVMAQGPAGHQQAITHVADRYPEPEAE